MRKGWDKYRLRDLCEVITKGTTPTSVGFEFTTTGINFIKVESITSEGNFIKSKFATISDKCNTALKRSQLKENDILFSIAGALGRTAIVKKEILPANTNQALGIIRLKNNPNFFPRFILLALNLDLIFEQVERFKGGVAQQNLSLEQLGNFEIPIPPLPEQKRIVAILDETFAAIDKVKANTEKNLQNAKDLFESYLQNVFANPGEDWEEKTIGEIASVEYGFTSKSSHQGHYRYIRITDIDKNGKQIEEDKKYIKYSKEAECFILKENDLLMARTGATFAKVLLYKNYEPSVFASYLIKINFKEDIENELYWYFTKTKFYWEQAISLSSGAAQPHFNGAALKQVNFPFPKSNSEQKELIIKFNILETEARKLEYIYKQKLNDLEELKKSILQKAFAGELKIEKALFV